MIFSKKELKKIFFKIENRVPFIPDFSEPWNLLKIIFISFLISVIYSFSIIDKSSDFYLVFGEFLNSFAPYILIFLFLLVAFSKIIKRLKPIRSIMLICSLSFLSIYTVESFLIKDFYNLLTNFDFFSRKISIAFGLIFVFLMYFDWREKNINPMEIQAQLSFLQSKMRPHFLFNTLNSVISLLKKDPNLAKKMLLNLSELLRASLKENNSFMHTIKEEYNLCENYLEIERIRLGERLQVSWDIDEKTFNSLIPKLSIQPLVENSILHGIQKIEFGGTINIKIFQEQSNIYIRIDNPIETSDNNDILIEEREHNNISVSNLQERLKICFDGDISLDSNIINSRYTVIIRIPNIKK